MKCQKKHRSVAIISALFFLFTSVFVFPAPDWPQTVAEESGYKATSTYSEVMSFIKKLQSLSPFLRVESLCTSTEGRDVPLMIVGNPVPASPASLKFDHRAVVYIQANIHAGEVEGKEASLMLARDILSPEKHPFLDNLILLLAPVFNADGNEKISPENRRNQVGPEQGVGVRYNGQNLDLNRDGMKLESPELRGLVKNVLLRWDPVLVVDCHTTNGSYHEEPVTYSWPLNPNGSRPIIAYMRDKMMPAIQKILLEKYQALSIPYGNFVDFNNPEKGWATFGHQARYVTNYIGLRNRLSILNENYAYADYRTRVLGCANFLWAILDYCCTHKEEILTSAKEADLEASTRGQDLSTDASFAVEFNAQPLAQPITVRGWEMEVIPRDGTWPLIKKTDKKRKYSLPYYADIVPQRTIAFPKGYLIHIDDAAVIENLHQHGIAVERLTERATLEVESFKITEIKGAERIYQGHRLNSVKGEYVKEQRDFPPGTYFVGTDQPLSNLAASLLEPESDDGLLVWNFFDRYIVPQWGRSHQVYPVHRLLNPARLVKTIVRSSQSD